jgi:uncharacterized protein
MRTTTARFLLALVFASQLPGCDRSEPAVAGNPVLASDEAVLQCSTESDCMANRLCDAGQCRFAERGFFRVKGQVDLLRNAVNSGRIAAGNYFNEKRRCPRSNVEVGGCKGPDDRYSIGEACAPPYRWVDFDELDSNPYTTSLRVGSTPDGDCLVEGVASDKTDPKIRGRKIMAAGRRNAKGLLDWQFYSDMDGKYLPDNMTRGLPGDTFAASTYPTSFDCAKADSTAEDLICHDADLASADVDLAARLQQARAAAVDRDALTRVVRAQWNDRDRTCHEKACVSQWIAHQSAMLAGVTQTGQVPGARTPAAAQQQPAGRPIQARAKPAVPELSRDQAYEVLRDRCMRGFLGALCRKKIRNQLCDGHWSDDPPTGSSICKRDR